MRAGLYAIKDVKVGFWKPFVQPNEGVAIREFSNLVNSPGNDFVAQNYADLELWCLGTYDDVTGEISTEVEYIVKGADVKRGVD